MTRLGSRSRRLRATARRVSRDLANEAFADLLKKHGRPTTLKEALRESARREPANDPHPPGSEPEPVESTAKRGVARPRKRSCRSSEADFQATNCRQPTGA